MPWDRDFRVSTITLDVDNSAETTLRGITNASAVTNVEVEQELSSQSIYPDTTTIRRARPTAQFTTVDLPGAFTVLGLVGKCINGDADDAGITFYGQKQDCIGIASGNVHSKYVMKSAIVVPNALTVDHMGNAQITYDVYARSADGTTAPVVYTTGVALPTVGLGPIGRWTMRNATIANTAISGKRQISINFNPVVTQEGADSELYDSVTSLVSLSPVVNIRGVDPAWFTTYGLTGISGTHVNTTMELKRRDALIGATEHYRVSANGLVVVEQIFGGAINTPSETAIRIHCNHDGTNAPLLVSAKTTLS